MTSYPNAEAWLQAFRLEPALRLDRLLRSFDSISPLQRGEPHDAALLALRSFGDGGDRTEADRALARWLEERLGEPLATVAEIGWNAYVSEVMEGFSLATRMPGEATGRLLRDRFEEFDAWTRSLSKDGPGDLRLRFLLALAQNQTTRRFLGLWYRLCTDCGRGLLPPIYLTAGITGLQRLPLDADGNPAIAECVEGLARWARHLPDSEDARDRFLMHWRAFTSRHPRKPDAWAALTADARSGLGACPTAAWWREELDLGEIGEQPSPVHRPEKADTDKLIGVIAGGVSPQVGEAVMKFAAWHERYAAASFDLIDLPRAFNRIGNALLRQGTRPAVALAERLAVRALDHVPNDENSWVLWAQAVEARGDRAQAEAILWRATRRFPDNAAVRTVLAGMLEQAGRVGEAEALYRETLRILPDNAHARAALAKLLAEHGRAPAAEALYRETLARAPGDDVARNALAKLLADHGRTDEAVLLYRETMERSSDNAVSRLDLGLLLLRLGRRDEVLPIQEELERLKHTGANTLRAHLEGKVKPQLWSPRSLPTLPEDVTLPTDAAAIRAGFRLSPALARSDFVLLTTDDVTALREKARALLTEALRGDPNNPVVRLMAHRHRIPGAVPLAREEARRVAARDYGLRLELARGDGDPLALEWLYEDFPDADRRALTACAWLHALGKAKPSPEALQAAAHLNGWLKAPAAPDLADSLRYLHQRLAKDLHRFVGGKTPFFLSGFGLLPPDAIDALIDIALVGLVLAEMPVVPLELADA